MRIISGKYGGRNIKTPSKKSIHPMGERIRNAIFNKIMANLEDAIVLDCFAGSGSVGIEALSRGARKVYFIEKERQAVQIIKQNLELLQVPENNYEIIPTTILNWLENAKDIPKFDLIFADPPYNKPQNNSILALANLLNSTGKIVLSNPKSAKDLLIPDLEIEDIRTYAEAKIIFYKNML